MKAARFLYRTRQFWEAIRRTPGLEDLERAYAVLTPPQRALFNRLHRSEQVQSLRILRVLHEQGETHPDLMVAALLHDVGKSLCPLRLWERVLIVLVRAVFPGLARRWGSVPVLKGAPLGWRRAFIVAEQHPSWGAEMAAQAGASSLVVALIRRHQDWLATSTVADISLEDGLLRKLQAVDDKS